MISNYILHYTDQFTVSSGLDLIENKLVKQIENKLINDTRRGRLSGQMNLIETVSPQKDWNKNPK